MTKLDFWYDFGSTYAYLSAMRIEALACAQSVDVSWRPFLLGPIFKDSGWTTSPFNLYPAKGRYMVRDVRRIAESRGLPFVLPEPFPANGLHAARIALALTSEGDRARFSRAVFSAAFDGSDRDIADANTLRSLLEECDLPTSLIDESRSDAIKARLRAQTGDAARQEIFGAPYFVAADGEPFWGDDRLEAALQHAQTLR